jgi:tRNA-dihydrouridine synthase
MKFLRDLLDKQKPLFEKGGKLESLYYAFEAGETFMFSPKHTTGIKGAQVKDAIDLKRMMITVVIAMIPCLLFGMYNTGHQHFLATGEKLAAPGLDERIAVAKKHLDFSVEWKGPKLGILEMRRHYTNYFRGMPNFKQYRAEMVTAETYEHVCEILNQVSDVYADHVF